MRHRTEIFPAKMPETGARPRAIIRGAADVQGGPYHVNRRDGKRRNHDEGVAGKLYEHLAEIDQTSRRRMEQIIPRMAKAEGVDEILKAKDQMVWVGRMNSIRQRAEEMILQELIYG